jgi:hypothetical protein
MYMRVDETRHQGARSQIYGSIRVAGGDLAFGSRGGYPVAFCDD